MPRGFARDMGATTLTTESGRGRSGEEWPGLAVVVAGILRWSGLVMEGGVGVNPSSLGREEAGGGFRLSIRVVPVLCISSIDAISSRYFFSHTLGAAGVSFPGGLVSATGLGIVAGAAVGGRAATNVSCRRLRSSSSARSAALTRSWWRK